MGVLVLVLGLGLIVLSRSDRGQQIEEAAADVIVAPSIAPPAPVVRKSITVYDYKADRLVQVVVIAGIGSMPKKKKMI